ncbi:MAG: ABC transporter substrate-binding protein [Devosia sp.]
MTDAVLRGLTWGHRRAVAPLAPLTAAFTASHPDISVDWIVRPLSDFEHQGLAGLADAYDLIIYDHPFSGSIVESGAFEPLSSHAGTRLELGDAPRYLGPSLLSYRFGGSVFGLPIDAATQHAAYRADLLAAAGEAVPQSWQDAIALGRRLDRQGTKLGLAVTTPHAGLTVAALMANTGTPWPTSPDEPFALDRAGFIDAYESVRELFTYCHADCLDFNAIDLHEAMVARDDIAYTPCVYGYGTYGEADHSHRLRFADFAGRVAPFHAGSVLGGTGLAVSRRSRHKAAALAFVRFAATEAGQALMQSAHGQPGLAGLWTAGEADTCFNGFFTAARRSIEAAWVRPRVRGYIEFQASFGALVAEGLRAGRRGTALWEPVESLQKDVNR